MDSNALNKKMLRVELGLEQSEWDTARELGLIYRAVEHLPLVSKDSLDKQMKLIALQLYGALFHFLGYDVVDKERRCLWLFEGYVSVFVVSTA